MSPLFHFHSHFILLISSSLIYFPFSSCSHFCSFFLPSSLSNFFLFRPKLPFAFPRISFLSFPHIDLTSCTDVSSNFNFVSSFLSSYVHLLYFSSFFSLTVYFSLFPSYLPLLPNSSIFYYLLLVSFISFSFLCPSFCSILIFLLSISDLQWSSISALWSVPGLWFIL